jgi:hypothetical protein
VSTPAATIELVSGPGVLIQVELCPELEHFLRPVGEMELCVKERVSALAEHFGVPAPERVERSAPGGPRAVRFVVGGRIVPVTLATLRRTWLTCADPDLHEMPMLDRPSASGNPDHWLRDFATQQPTAHGDRRALLSQFIGHLAAAALALHAAPLLGAEAAQAYFDPAEEWFAKESSADVLHQLLGLGVSVRDRESIKRLARGCHAVGGSVEAAVEELFARLVRREITVFANPEWVAADKRDESLAGKVRLNKRGAHAGLSSVEHAVEQRLADLGMTRKVTFSLSHEMIPGQIRVQVNDRLGLPIPVARYREVAVQYPPSVVTHDSDAGRLLVDAASGHQLVALPEEDAPSLVDQRLSPVDAEAYLAVAIVRELMQFSEELIDLDDVEQDLADLESSHPELVHTVLRWHSPVRLTRIFRALLAEQVGIRDGWAILNAVLRYGAVSLPPPGRRVFDDRVAVADPEVRARDAPVADVVSFIRLQMKAQLVAEQGLLSGGPPTLLYYGIDEALEAALRERGARGRSFNADEPLRRAISRGLALAGSPADALLIVDPAVRVPLREVIAPEFPTLRAMAETELMPGASTKLQGIISLEPPEPH